MKKQVCLLATISLMFFACSKDKDPNTGDNNQGRTFQLDSFPLAVGNSWKYHTEVDVDTEGVHYLDIRIDSYWNVISDTLINSVHVSKVAQLDSNYSGTKTFGYTYYANKADGFYGVAYAGNSSSFNLKNIGLKFKIRSALFGSFGNGVKGGDSLYIPDTSLHLMKFPVCIGNLWCSYEYGNSDYYRKWIGFELVTTPAGSFQCVKLQLFHDGDHNGQPDDNFPFVYQYFSTKGLVQETMQESLIFNSMTTEHVTTGYLTKTTKLVQVNF